jgi:hypothetical protein
VCGGRGRLWVPTPLGLERFFDFSGLQFSSTPLLRHSSRMPCRSRLPEGEHHPIKQAAVLLLKPLVFFALEITGTKAQHIHALAATEALQE